MSRAGAHARYAAYRRRRQNGGRGMPRWMLLLIALGVLFAISLGVLGGVSYGIYNHYSSDVIPPDEEIARLPLGGAEIRDRNGVPLYEFFDDVTGLRTYVPADQISLNLIAATIAAEDATFLDNPGVNYRGVANAAIDNFWPFGDTPGLFEGRGGSSITQQLVKNIYFTPEERAERSVSRKIKETVIAIELTREYSKEQILEWYLNLISYGNVFIGAEAASNGYFDKSAKDLTLAEAATLAAIPSCPTCYDPINEPEAALEQRNVLLRRMNQEEFISRELMLETMALPLGVDLQPFPVLAPHFVFNVVRPELERLFGPEALQRDGLVVFTTLDLGLQRQAEAILEEWITTFEDSGGHNGAVVAIDPTNAEILTYIGSRDYFREDIDGQNDMADALNSPGSAFKPFTYLTSFIERGYGPGTMVLDTEFPSEFWGGARPPRNPGTGYQGPITLRNSLGNSLNIPAVKTILYAGVLNVIERAQQMGITGLIPSNLGPALTVGGIDVKLNDMVYAYTAFPNLGVLKGVESTVARQEGDRNIDPVSILRVENSDGEVIYPLIAGEPSAEGPYLQERRVAPAAEAYMINSILSDGCAQTITFGACGALSISGRPIGIKTGTSEPYANSFAIGDTWAIGYTPQLVVGSWFGNADNSPMTGISSTSVSWRSVRDVLVAGHEGLPVLSFTRPPGLVEAEACVPSGLLPTDTCPLVTPADLFAADSLPTKEDDWWQTVRIDTRTDLLAGPLTPNQFVAELPYLQIPGGLSAWERNQAEEWAEHFEASLEDLPTDVTTASDLPIEISSPTRAEQVSGLVNVLGRANSSDFAGYRLDYRFNTEQGEWFTFAEGDTAIESGFLGTWDTRDLPVGLYTIRLLILDDKLGLLTTQVQVLVVSAVPPPPEDPAPTPDSGPTTDDDT